MSPWDWALVVGLNGAIILYGLYLSRGVRSSADWFLAGRSLPWWLVGISMYATAIDSSDLVADAGGTYLLGFSYFATNWVGAVLGWILAAFFICLPMYRAGLYTNAEYLETRYGTPVRVICAFVQVQYRTLVLGIIATTLFLTLSIVCGLSDAEAWTVVGLIAALAAIYTAFGGLRSVAMTDSLQFGVMTVAGLIIWLLVWGQVGGWEGMERRLNAHDPAVAARLLHAGHENVQNETVAGKSSVEIQRKLGLGGNYDADSKTIRHHTPGWLMALALVIMGMAYSIVNHTQVMRMFAARSEWDLKMSVVAASCATLAMTFFNLSMGVMGRALYPEQSALPDGRQDAIYPLLVSQIETVGLKGIVVAGILAASLSTYDSIGSALSALLTRDVYARLLVPGRDDRHYLRISQWLTPAVIAISFFYIPGLLRGGMVLYYLDLTSAFVIPLLTIYLMGSFTRVHRSSGLIGLLAGAAYGILRMAAPLVAEQTGWVLLPPVMMGTYAAYPFSMLVTAATMVLVSQVTGWESGRASDLTSRQEESAWLRSSQLRIRQIQEEISKRAPQGQRLPALLSTLALAVGCVLTFVVFW